MHGPARSAPFLLAFALAAAGCGDRNCPDPVDTNGSGFVVVRPSTLGQNGVTQFSTADSTGSTTFVVGPAVAPYGRGSVEFAIGPNGDGAEELRFDQLDGGLLSDITALAYWTYVQAGSGLQAPYLILRVDWDANGTQDDLVFFEPEYQHGYTATVPDQGDLVVGSWQRWNARAGGWWSLFDPAFGPGAGVTTLDAYLAAHPGSRVVPGTDASGGLRLVTGFGAPSWDGFVGNADGLEVGVLGAVTIYDLDPEPATP